MKLFRNKPVIVEAEQFFKDQLPCPIGIYPRLDCSKQGGGAWCDIHQTFHRFPVYGIKTLEGELIVSDGDWIVTGVKGEKYPVKPDIFKLTYDPLDEEQG